ncbi:uncharacterized protein LOC115450111 isoform X2 [Manduca sexta]|uniref:uncharacterized protein LOC115450111 isoform X2 n=1 Tax=Manduca sexta TaxID=7130 RepID=UPI00118443A5|nr:uncharacterized protein LOC115450111 isoform X2 [Manduca sexta]
MTKHGDLSIISGKSARNVLLWMELIGILNQIGVGPRKTLEQWKKTWSDLKYRTKEKVLKIQQASSSRRRNLSALTQVEEKVCEIIKNNRRCLQEPNEEIQTTEEQKDSLENEENADPVFIEFIDHTESFSPAHKAENSPSPSPSSQPDTELRRKRKRSNSYEDSNEFIKHESTSFNNATSNAINVEEENRTIQYHRQLIELKRLELETLRENNLHEREKERAQIYKEKIKETIKIQQQIVSFLQDIKPALINFLNK